MMKMLFFEMRLYVGLFVLDWAVAARTT